MARPVGTAVAVAPAVAAGPVVAVGAVGPRLGWQAARKAPGPAVAPAYPVRRRKSRRSRGRPSTASTILRSFASFDIALLLLVPLVPRAVADQTPAPRRECTGSARPLHIDSERVAGGRVHRKRVKSGGRFSL